MIDAACLESNQIQPDLLRSPFRRFNELYSELKDHSMRGPLIHPHKRFQDIQGFRRRSGLDVWGGGPVMPTAHDLRKTSGRWGTRRSNAGWKGMASTSKSPGLVFSPNAMRGLLHLAHPPLVADFGFSRRRAMAVLSKKGV